MLWQGDGLVPLFSLNMKTCCTAFVLAGSCLWAQELPPSSPESESSGGAQVATAPATEAPLAEISLDTYLDAGNKVAEAMKELTGILQRVNSKETADAACEEVGRAARKLLEANRSAESLPAPSDALQAELVDQLTQSGFIHTTQQFLKTLMNLAAHECYESESLQEALKVLEDAESDS